MLWLPRIEPEGAHGQPGAGYQGRPREGRRHGRHRGSRQACREPSAEGAPLYRPAAAHAASGKLPDAVIADFRSGSPRARWTRGSIRGDNLGRPEGNVDRGRPQVVGVSAGAGAGSARASAIRAGRRTKSIRSCLARLEEQKVKPSAAADPRTLVRRAYVDLVGYKPTYEEVEAFANDRSPDAWANLIDRLLASPHYGERWGRHWMDVARYGEDNPTAEATNPAYPFAWRYRDWVIEAINQDVPYDRFVKLQLAADLMPDATRDDMRALGLSGRRARSITRTSGFPQT